MPDSPLRPPGRPGEAWPRLSVVVVNYDGWEDVDRLVKGLAGSPEMVGRDCELVIVDNASQGPVPPDLRGPRPGVRVLIREENGGFAAGVNTGWLASEAPWLLILNPDVVPGPDFLARVLERLPDGPDRPGIVGFALRNIDGSRQPSVGRFPGLFRSLRELLIPRSRRKYQSGWRTRPGPVDWVTGACMLVDAQLLELLGGMDEDFFLYYEEVALCRAARRAGRRIEFDDRIEVVHLHPLQNRPLTPRMRIITRHSKLLYFRKHLPRWQFEALARLVGLEARLRSLAVARVRGRQEESRSWRAIAVLADEMRAGSEVRGPAVRDLAGSIALPDRDLDRNLDADDLVRAASGPRRPRFRIRPGALPARRPRSRKDGQECPPHNTQGASSR